MEIRDIFNDSIYPTDIDLEKFEKKGGAQAFDKDMERAKMLLHRINDTQARIDEMLENSNYSPEENAEKRGIK